MIRGILQRWTDANLHNYFPRTAAQAAWTALQAAIPTTTREALDNVVEKIQAYNDNLDGLSELDETAGLVEQTAEATFTKRAIGVAASTSIPTRADADDRYDAIDAASDAITAHEAAGNPHPTYLTAAEGNAAYDATGAAAAAQAASQPLHAILTALAGLTIAAGKLIVGTGTNAFSVYDLNAYIRDNILNKASAAAILAELGTTASPSLNTQTDDYEALAADKGKIVYETGTAKTITLDNAADYGSGWFTTVKAGAASVSLATKSGELLDGVDVTTVPHVVTAYESIKVFCTGTAFLSFR